MHCVFVETSLDTRLVVLLHKTDNVSVFKGETTSKVKLYFAEKLRKEHSKCFSEIGKITTSAVKIEWSGRFYHLPDSVIVSKAFEYNGDEDWFIFVDVDTEVAASSKADDKFLEKKAEITNAPVIEEEDLKTKVDEEKKSKKRKMKSFDATKSTPMKLDESDW
ncbi:hypothetical protein EUTSA_v10028078mg [Eutrema salsugineum]|uniref:Uncharacterized protein n=1 Tax=Eutrema salsugineum TaxID=72664 RepID=V4LXT4_EUTSA|nr:hypothetical protein EUTSA_v10028078mg [Eutrema salsugineum]